MVLFDCVGDGCMSGHGESMCRKPLEWLESKIVSGTFHSLKISEKQR
jgi:hypothetical protein